MGLLIAWHERDSGATPNEIRPFRISIPQEDLEDLRERLLRTRWPAQLPGGGWNRGLAVNYLKNLAEYWQTDYSWRENEAKLNELLEGA
ncbi:epoxide hydrolase N-terminal domain-containing protein [Paenibacillus glucanolyticus]|uniref:epoxide hydrolase N-terminal domain-containing protein n=1 Tax=Paenibacillus glucanolyticus TaxID=59843 RepID=UPI00096F9F02|nr:epoxide hydrolase N-terminal domain-containing protein [Paenibacillus glucanolyticus]OMF66235.1 hypothetical protein BK142_29505 [Paenibacillus glucanolyticus]